MIRFLIPVILVVLAVILARRYIYAAPADKQKSRKIDVLLVVALIALVILTLLHRMHWLGVTLPVLIMAGRKVIAFFTARKKTKDSPEKNDQQEP